MVVVQLKQLVEVEGTLAILKLLLLGFISLSSIQCTPAEQKTC